MPAVSHQIEPTVKQWSALGYLDNEWYTRVLFDGGSRSGKTWLILLWIMITAEKFPLNFKALICRHKLKDVKATAWKDTMKRSILPKFGGWRAKETPVPTLIGPKGQEIVFEGLDSDERVAKIMGDEFNLIHVNEGTQVSYSMVGDLLTRLARRATNAEGKEAPRKLIIDCNPKSRRHWLHRVGVEHVDPETLAPLTDAKKWVRLHWTPFDNPHLPEDYIETLRALPDVKRRRMLNGEWCDQEGMVYSEFDEDVHVVRGDDHPAWYQSAQKVRGIDFGFVDPFACLWGAIGPDSELYIYRERYVRGETVRAHAQAIKAVSEHDYVQWTVADHDAEDRATLEENGIATVLADKRIKVGVETVQQRLQVARNGRPRLLVHESCTNTLNEFYAYIWPPSPDGRSSKEVPKDKDNHAMDALRYMVMQLDDGFQPAAF